MRAGATVFGPRALAPLALAIATLAVPAGAEATTTCSYSAGTNTLSVGGDPDVGTSLSVSGTGEIQVSHIFANGVGTVDCGATDPTTTNTDTIDVDHFSPDEGTVFRILDLEKFAPGTIDEGGGLIACPDEIEIDVSLGDGPDLIDLRDLDGSDDNLVLGDDGVDRNPSQLCPDVELEPFLNPEYRVRAENGNDTVSGQGGNAAGGPLVHALDLHGGSGKDLVRGGDADDLLTGGPGGKDKLFGMEGSDGLFAEDGKADRKIDCGPGPKLEEFAVTDRRKDPKPISC